MAPESPERVALAHTLAGQKARRSTNPKAVCASAPTFRAALFVDCLPSPCLSFRRRAPPRPMKSPIFSTGRSSRRRYRPLFLALPRGGLGSGSGSLAWVGSGARVSAGFGSGDDVADASGRPPGASAVKVRPGSDTARRARWISRLSAFGAHPARARAAFDTRRRPFGDARAPATRAMAREGRTGRPRALLAVETRTNRRDAPLIRFPPGARVPRGPFVPEPIDVFFPSGPPRREPPCSLARGARRPTTRVEPREGAAPGLSRARGGRHPSPLSPHLADALSDITPPPPQCRACTKKHIPNVREEPRARGARPGLARSPERPRDRAGG